MVGWEEAWVLEFEGWDEDKNLDDWEPVMTEIYLLATLTGSDVLVYVGREMVREDRELSMI